MRAVRPTKFEVDGLKSLADNLDCTMPELINAIMSNCVTEEIGKQLQYNRMSYKHLKEISEIHAKIDRDPENCRVDVYPQSIQDEFKSCYGFSISDYRFHVACSLPMPDKC